jgi:hypothetical protein
MYVSWKYFVLVLVLAVSGHDVCDETDLSYLLQGRTSSIDALKFAPFSKQIPKIFCWVIEGPGAGPHVELVVEQMAGCDDYRVFSNSSSNEKVVALYQDDMVLEKVRGWINNTGQVAEVYRFLTNSKICDDFDWIVKLDPDTFFRAGPLRKILADYDPNEALAVSSWKKLEGAMEVLSRGVFRQNGPLSLFQDTLDIDESSIFDDKWLDYAVHHMNAEVVQLPTTECLSLVLNGYNVWENLLNNMDAPMFTQHFDKEQDTWRPDLWQEDFRTSPPCISRDIVAIHPVKNLDHYREFQRLTQSEDQA